MGKIKRSIAGIILAVASIIGGVGITAVAPSAVGASTLYDFGWHNTKDGSGHFYLVDHCNDPLPNNYPLTNCRIFTIDSNRWRLGEGVIIGATQIGLPYWAWVESIIDGNPYGNPRIAATVMITQWAPYDASTTGFAWTYGDPCGTNPICGSYTVGTQLFGTNGITTYAGNSVHNNNYAWLYNQQDLVRGRFQWTAKMFVN